MASRKDPRGKLCRGLQTDLELFSGVRDSETKYKKKVAPGGRNRARSMGDYGQQLREKQKLRIGFGLKEGQFVRAFKEASRRKGATGENLIAILEGRLDNIVYRAGFATTRAEARQLVSHKAVLVNGQSVNIPSYDVKVGDEVTIREKSAKQTRVQDAVQINLDRGIVDWIDLDSKSMSAKLARLPERNEVHPDIDENLIVELYSR